LHAELRPQAPVNQCLQLRAVRHPRNFTGEPSVRPWIDSSKYTTKRCGFAKILTPPNVNTAITPSANAPITNEPMMVGLTLVFTKKKVRS
jgi:hypothetical protein